MTYKYKEIEPPKYRGMKPAVRNGNLSLSEEHYRFVQHEAASHFANRERYPSGVCTVKGRRGTALDKAMENRKRHYEYNLNADENLILEEIINFYLANRNQNNVNRPERWIPVE